MGRFDCINSLHLFFSCENCGKPAMEGISLKNLISAVHGFFPTRSCLTGGLSERVPGIKLKSRVQITHSRFGPSAKGSAFQDFQGFAKPLRLLPATEVNICLESFLEERSASFKLDESFSLYNVQLQTSGDFGSSLSDLNAAIFLCLIDVNGDSILQRIPMISSYYTGDTQDISDSSMRRFQRGSTNKITFKGPKLREIEALWIGVESGCWRLGGITLTVISSQESSLSSSDNGKQNKYSGQQYEFKTSDILLGEGGGVSVAELRPSFVTDLDRVDSSTIFSTGFSPSISLTDNKISSEESMKEYADLKLSLLLYDAILIFIGTSISAFAGEKAAYAFVIGGAGGVLYLLVLQKSVDGLPTSTASALGNKRVDLARVFGGYRGPLSILALALTLITIAVTYGLGIESVALTPKELLVGVAGFLTFKIAVVLAAFKPLHTNMGEKK